MAAFAGAPNIGPRIDPDKMNLSVTRNAVNPEYVTAAPSNVFLCNEGQFFLRNESPHLVRYQIHPFETLWIRADMKQIGLLEPGSEIRIAADAPGDEAQESGVIHVLVRPVPVGTDEMSPIEMDHPETQILSITIYAVSSPRRVTDGAGSFMVAPTNGCRPELDLLCLPRDNTPAVAFTARYIPGWQRKVIVMATPNPFKALWFLYDGITPYPFTFDSTSHRTPVKVSPQAQIQFQDLTRVDLLRTVAALGEMANWYSIEYACLQCAHDDPELLFNGQHPTHISDSDPNKLRFFRVVLVVPREGGATDAALTTAAAAPVAPTPAAPVPTAATTAATTTAIPPATNYTLTSAPFLWLRPGTNIEEFLARHGGNFDTQARVAALMAPPTNPFPFAPRPFVAPSGGFPGFSREGQSDGGGAGAGATPMQM